MPINGYEVFST